MGENPPAKSGARYQFADACEFPYKWASNRDTLPRAVCGHTCRRGPMTDGVPTWDDEVKKYFTQVEVGCMSTVEATPPLDLADYTSVKDYISFSEANKEKILFLLKNGIMPKGGPPWSEDRFNRFKAWIDAGYPKSSRDGSQPARRRRGSSTRPRKATRQESPWGSSALFCTEGFANHSYSCSYSYSCSVVRLE